MLAAPFPSNELKRLQALLDFKILDTPPEIAFDDITALASSICGAPVALVSLIDRNRQWFKSSYGINVTETPREISFCAHAIHHHEVFIIEDASQDQRFSDNPLVANAPHIRFYAGAPLVTQEGFALGTLCVVDMQPKRLESHQIRALEALARQVIHLLELRRAHDELKKNHDELRVYADLVANQQNSLLYSAKMTSLGEMAGGIAHEINNPLAIVIGKTELMISDFEENKVDSKKCLDSLIKIRVTAQRMSKIVKGLLAFSRDGNKDAMEAVDLHTIVSDTVAMVSEKFRNCGINIKVSVPQGEKVLCRPTQISQVVTNLLSNSFYAIEDHDEKWITVETQNIGSQIRLIITDSGHGIPPEIQEKIMAPFYTTKPVGEGTGLGLSISKGLAEASGGSLLYDPRKPHTTFVLSLERAPVPQHS